MGSRVIQLDQKTPSFAIHGIRLQRLLAVTLITANPIDYIIDITQNNCSLRAEVSFDCLDEMPFLIDDLDLSSQRFTEYVNYSYYPSNDFKGYYYSSSLTLGNVSNLTLRNLPSNANVSRNEFAISFRVQQWITEAMKVFIIPGIHDEGALDNFKVLIKPNVIATIVPSPETYKEDGPLTMHQVVTPSKSDEQCRYFKSQISCPDTTAYLTYAGGDPGSTRNKDYLLYDGKDDYLMLTRNTAVSVFTDDNCTFCLAFDTRSAREWLDHFTLWTPFWYPWLPDRPDQLELSKRKQCQTLSEPFLGSESHPAFGEMKKVVNGRVEFEGYEGNCYSSKRNIDKTFDSIKPNPFFNFSAHCIVITWCVGSNNDTDQGFLLYLTQLNNSLTTPGTTELFDSSSSVPDLITTKAPKSPWKPPLFGATVWIIILASLTMIAFCVYLLSGLIFGIKTGIFARTLIKIMDRHTVDQIRKSMNKNYRQRRIANKTEDIASISGKAANIVVDQESLTCFVVRDADIIQIRVLFIYDTASKPFSQLNIANFAEGNADTMRVRQAMDFFMNGDYRERLAQTLFEVSRFDRIYETCLINVLICDLIICLCEILIPVSRLGMLFTKRNMATLSIFPRIVVTLLMVLIWGWSAGIGLYIVGWVDMDFMFKGNNYSIAYATVTTNLFLTTYSNKCIPGFLFVTIIIYILFFIILYLRNLFSSNAQLKARVVRSVLAAMLQNLAGLISSLPNLYDILQYENRSWKWPGIPIQIFQLLFKLGTNFYATFTAWIVIICIKEYRQPVLKKFFSLCNFGQQKIGMSNTSKQATTLIISKK
ncbi:unnamed protein product, partial [Mesorhabditis belari]|uniref:Uncharacterized protein n=1 Tax=Mesorhabditis belari TaxID=2138241 RepID=A0AAF3EKJ4_9BILA